GTYPNFIPLPTPDFLNDLIFFIIPQDVDHIRLDFSKSGNVVGNERGEVINERVAITATLNNSFSFRYDNLSVTFQFFHNPSVFPSVTYVGDYDKEINGRLIIYSVSLITKRNKLKEKNSNESSRRQHFLP